MGSLTVPKLALLAGAAVCLVVGYLLGAGAAPDADALTTATVDSVEPAHDLICLRGAAVRVIQGVDSTGRLCGRWRRSGGQTARVGSHFRFVAVPGSRGTEVFGTAVGSGAQ